MPTKREYAMAAGLLQGKSATRAACDAGYGRRYAHNEGTKIARQRGVQEALQEIGLKVDPKKLGTMAMAKLEQDLLRSEEYSPKERMAVIRTCLEVADLIGGHNELHLHQHNYAPATQKLLQQYNEFLALKGEVGNGRQLPERAESPN